MISNSFLEISSPTSSRSTSPTPVKASSDEAVEEMEVSESQPMSIHKIDPMKIASFFKMKISEAEIQIIDLIKRVVALYNQHMGESDQFNLISDRSHPLTEEPIFPTFRMAIYAKVTERTTRLANWIHELEPSFNAVTKKAEYVFFLYRYMGSAPHTVRDAEIFGLTTSTAWHVLEKFRDFTFPGQIARRWLKPELSGQTKRPLLGRILMVDEVFKQETKPTQSEVIDQMFMRMKTYTLPFASVFGLKFAQKRRAPNLLFKLGIGMIRIEGKAAPQYYAGVLDLCSRISRGEKTYQFDKAKKVSLKTEERDSEEFDYLDFRQPASIVDVHRLNRALDTVLWNAFTGKSRLPILDFCHKFISDYFFAGSFTLFMRNKQIHEWSKPLSALDMVVLVREKIPALAKCTSVEAFSELLNLVEVGFSQDNKIKRGPFREYIEGEILLEDGSSFWRLRNMWYVVQADYLSLITQEFCALLKESLLSSDHPAALSKPFSLSEYEAQYNRRYIGEKGVIFGDGICPLNMELFDLAWILDEEICLIQVKRGLNKDIRVGCSQIRNAAKNLKEKGKINSGILKKFFELAVGYKGAETHRLQLRKQLEEMGEKTFLKHFSKKIVFVYAVVDDVRVRDRLRREKDLDLQMNAKRIGGFHRDFAKNAEGIFAELQRQDFLTKKGYPSTKFLATNQERFTQEFSSKDLTAAAKKELFKAIKGHTSLLSSNVAKLELLRLRNELEDMGFEFRICQVPLEKDALPSDPSTWTEEERAVLSKLPDVDETHLYQELGEGDTFKLGGRPYKICPTEADGACGLHALDGILDEKKGKYIFTVTSEVRGQFNNIRELYWGMLLKLPENEKFMIFKLFNDMLRQYLGSYPTNESKLLYRHNELEKVMLELKKELHECDQQWDGLSRSEVEFFKDLPMTCPKEAFEQILEKMRGDVSLMDFKQKYVSNASLFVSVCTEHCKQILTLLAKTDLGDKLAKIQNDKEEIRLDKEDLLDEFIKNNRAKIFTLYKEICQRDDYYYSDIELGIIAIACGIKLTIVPHRLLLETGDPITYGVEGEEVVIFHKGNHYSRCVLEKKRKRQD